MNIFNTSMKLILNQNYVRTPEDEEKDRNEAAWKAEQTRQAISAFLRHNPSGRVIPKMH